MTTYAVGTARVTNASAVVTGTDTTWAVSAVAGGLFTMGGMAIPIRSVESDTSLTLEYAATTTRTGAYSILLLTAQAASAIEIYRRIQENVAALRNLSPLGRAVTAVETTDAFRQLIGVSTGRFQVDASGPFSQRAQYDDRPPAFSFLATDQGLLYLREGASGWSTGLVFGKGDDGREIEIRATSTRIEWRYEGEAVWQALVPLATLKGADGREAEFRRSETHVQWRLVGDESWLDLFALALIKGDQGDEAVSTREAKDAASVAQASEAAAKVSETATETHSAAAAESAAAAIAARTAADDAKAEAVEARDDAEDASVASEGFAQAATRDAEVAARARTDAIAARLDAEAAAQAVGNGVIAANEARDAAIGARQSAETALASAETARQAAENAARAAAASAEDAALFDPSSYYTKAEIDARPVPDTSWDGIEGKPATFPPDTHSHTADETTSGTFAIARLPVAASGASNTTEVVRADDERLSDARSPTRHTHDFGDITSKPAAYPPAGHTHSQSEITGLVEALSELAALSVDGPAINARIDRNLRFSAAYALTFGRL